MTKLLLDFPWSLESFLDPYSDGFEVLRDFEELRTTENLERVRFIGSDGYDAFCVAVYGQPPRSDVLQVAFQVLPHYVRREGGNVRARPVAGPNDLPDSWYFALREEMSDLDDWRTPQIIASVGRREDWKDSITRPDDEVEVRITCEDHDRTYQRVFAHLGSYSAHRYAKSDRDPWDLRRLYQPRPDAPAHQAHPCLLPKPPGLDGIELSELAMRLGPIRNWEIDGRYFYIPPKNWTHDRGSQADWRQGRGFPRKSCPHCGKASPYDFQDEVWCWDETHRHWDVQRVGPDYWSISHDGSFITQKRKGG